MAVSLNGLGDGELNLKTGDAVSIVRDKIDGRASYIGKCFVTLCIVANMRLFSRMSPDVYSQRTSLNETFLAVFVSTLVRSLVGVYPVVSAEV
jgi:hypothetical protein